MLKINKFATTFLLILIFSISAYCNSSSQATPQSSPKIVVVFADVSASVKDFGRYRDSWGKILSQISEGDRVVLGTITDETLTSFRPIVDEELPKFNWLSDNKLRYEKRIKETKQKLAGGFEELLKAPRSQSTDILNSLNIAEKIFFDDKRRRVLVILSDMLEDSVEYKFEKVKISNEFTKQVIKTKREKGVLPDLTGTTVYVACAYAQSAAKAQDIQKFWVEYFKACNALLEKQHYGACLISFNE